MTNNYNKVGKPTFEITDVKESKLKKLTNSIKKNSEKIKMGLGVLTITATLGYGYSTDKIEKTNGIYTANSVIKNGNSYLHFGTGKTIEGNPSKWNLKTGKEYTIYTEKPNFGFLFPDRVSKIEETK